MSPERLINDNVRIVAYQFHHDARDVPGIVYTAVRTPDKLQTNMVKHSVDIYLVNFVEVVVVFAHVHPTLKIMRYAQLQLTALVFQKSVDVPRSKQK